MNIKRSIFALVCSTAFATPAFAADVIVEEPVPERFFSWTGFYVGLIGGFGVSDHDFEAGPIGGVPTLAVTTDGSGGFIGAQVGYDWQINSFVIGAVADIAATSIDTSVAGVLGGVAFAASSDLDYFGTVRARLGYAWDTVLVYGHGGFAYGKASQDVTLAGVPVFSGSQSKNGWTIGLGAEFMAFDNVSVGLEYSYLDLGRDTVFVGGGIAATEDLTAHIGKLSINYRF